MTTVLDEIRKAMKSSRHSRYRIWKETGITEGQLSRFVSGERGLSVETVQRLAEYLGYDLVLVRRDRK